MKLSQFGLDWIALVWSPDGVETDTHTPRLISIGPNSTLEKGLGQYLEAILVNIVECLGNYLLPIGLAQPH